MRGERETEETGGGHGCRERKGSRRKAAREFDLKIGSTCDICGACGIGKFTILYNTIIIRVIIFLIVKFHLIFLYYLFIL